MAGFEKPVFFKKASPVGFWILLGFLGTGLYWVVLAGFFSLNGRCKCYSHQVNPEMENDYSVFIVNFMKITTEFNKVLM